MAEQSSNFTEEMFCFSPPDNPPSAELLNEIGRLRIVAWEADGERPAQAANCGDVWLDEHDDHAHHFIIRKDGVLVAAARLCIHNNKHEIPDPLFLSEFMTRIVFPVAFLNRLVVHPVARRRGLAVKLDATRINFAKQHGAKSALVHTGNLTRLRHLQNDGFKILGETARRFVTTVPNFALTRSL